MPAYTDAAEQLVLFHASDWSVDPATTGIIPDTLRTLTGSARSDGLLAERITRIARPHLPGDPRYPANDDSVLLGGLHGARQRPARP